MLNVPTLEKSDLNKYLWSLRDTIHQADAKRHGHGQQTVDSTLLRLWLPHLHHQLVPRSVCVWSSSIRVYVFVEIVCVCDHHLYVCASVRVYVVVERVCAWARVYVCCWHGAKQKKRTGWIHPLSIVDIYAPTNTSMYTNSREGLSLDMIYIVNTSASRTGGTMRWSGGSVCKGDIMISPFLCMFVSVHNNGRKSSGGCVEAGEGGIHKALGNSILHWGFPSL